MIRKGGSLLLWVIATFIATHGVTLSHPVSKDTKNSFYSVSSRDKYFLNTNAYLLIFNKYLLFLRYNFNFNSYGKKKQLRI